MRDARVLSHPLARLSSRLFDNGYLLPVAERLLADQSGWTATSLASALGVQGPNKVRAALGRLESADLVKVVSSGSTAKVIKIIDISHPFWTFVKEVIPPGWVPGLSR